VTGRHPTLVGQVSRPPAPGRSAHADGNRQERRQALQPDGLVPAPLPRRPPVQRHGAPSEAMFTTRADKAGWTAAANANTAVAIAASWSLVACIEEGAEDAVEQDVNVVRIIVEGLTDEHDPCGFRVGERDDRPPWAAEVFDAQLIPKVAGDPVAHGFAAAPGQVP